MDIDNFRDWLNEYGKAWENKNLAVYEKIFSKDASYYWTPFDEPIKGIPGIAEAIKSAVSTQQDIVFKYEMLSFESNSGVAHWTCKLKRIATGKSVIIDGILLAEFDDKNLCKSFREWWHVKEN